MLKIGITGNIGSGKTTICRVFEYLGVAVYYSDAKAKQFYHDVAVKCRIKHLFGESVFDAEQNVDTKKLANIVFQNEDLLQELNHLIHPLVINDFQEWCSEQKEQNFVLFESAIIYQCGLENLFDKIIFVESPADLSLQRIVKRDKVDEKSVKKRLGNQQKNDNGHLLADFIIHNDEKKSLMQEIIKIYKILNISK